LPSPRALEAPTAGRPSSRGRRSTIERAQR
jgi:hypothetical protein